ncbi:hypothetical protein FQN50_009374 [Emmonsiellopsis sp. PD_5]|nr:hypothetical protein FQN50_009374 [Emmonsiellopsis sp. PD_5]
MFDLPGAKRVRREELQSRRSTSRSPSPTESTTATYAADALRNIFSSIETFAPAEPSADPSNPHLENIENEEEEHEFEFRLFHAPTHPGGKSGSQDGAEEKRKDAGGDEGAVVAGGQEGKVDSGIRKLKIRIRSPTLAAIGDGEGRFVVPFRGWDYYFSDPDWIRRQISGKDGGDERGGEIASRGEEVKRFAEVALSGDKILEDSSSTWPGCHLPWRVIHLKPGPSKKKSSSSRPSNETSISLINPSLDAKIPKSRKKPGKKRRIVLRQRLAASKAAEEADREKRTRRNREKKIKKRQKEREKKAALREGESGAGSEVGKSESGDVMPDEMSE